MAYVKHDWSSGREGGTPITAAALDEMEDGIDLAINQGLTVGAVTTGAVAAAGISGPAGAKKLDLTLPQTTDYGWIHAGHANNNGMPNEALFMNYSPDGKSVVGGKGNPLYRPSSTGTSLRDPHIQRINGEWVMCYTANSGQQKTLEVAKSQDLTNWALAATVDVSATTNMTWSWAPELAQDNDGSWYMFYTAVNTSVSPATHEIWRVKATNAALTTWSAPVKVTWTTAPTGNPIDPAFIKVGDTWQIFYGLDGTILRATASSLAGTWTTDRTGDWAGWVANAVDGANHRGYEGPELEWAEPNRLRIYLDRYLVSPTNYPSGYVYSDSLDNGATWSAPKVVAVGQGFPPDAKVRHGTWYKIRTALEHEQVMAAVFGTSGRIRHAEYTSSASATIAANAKWAGALAVDAANSFNPEDFVSLSGKQLTIQRDGIYSVDWLLWTTVAVGGWMAIKGPGETPVYASNDLPSGVPSWSVAASNLYLKTGTVLEFYIQVANNVTLPAGALRVRLTKVQ